MKRNEELRYTVGVNRIKKCLNLIFSIMLLFIGLFLMIFSIYQLIQGESLVICLIMCISSIIFLIFPSLYFYHQGMKNLKVYHGFLIYSNGFDKKEYSVHSIKHADLDSYEIKTPGPSDYSYDYVTTKDYVFYDKRGKILFRFDYKVPNANRFAKEIRNINKSTINNKRKLK